MLTLAGLWLFALSISSASAPSPAIVLRNVRVLDVEAGSFGEPTDLFVDGSRISAVGAVETPRGPRLEIDCGGRFALPGLFDCHTHLAHLTTLGEDSLRAALAGFVARGITQVRDVGGPIDVLHDLRRQMGKGALTGPELFYAGPLLERAPLTHGRFNDDLPGFTVAIESPAGVDSLLAELAAKGACMVKTFNRIDRELYRHLVDGARRHSLRIVHDPGPPLFHQIPVDVALTFGVTSIEHAKAPWPIVLTAELRAEHDALLSSELGEAAAMAFFNKVADLGIGSVDVDRVRALGDLMVKGDAYLCPTLQVFGSLEEEAFAEMREHLQLQELPEAIKAMARKALAAMQDVSLLFARELSGRGVKLLVGQDGFDPIGTFGEMRRLADAGVSEIEIVRGATLYPARWLGVEDRLGSIAPGREATLLVVEGNVIEDLPQISSTYLVIQRGNVVFSAQHAAAAPASLDR